MAMLPDTVFPSFKDQELPAAAAACGILHHVFYFKPNRAFLQEVGQQGFLAQWPNCTAVSSDAAVIIEASLDADSFVAIEKDYYQLFIGPGGMNAYPWGSVYTHRENLVCGDTTREFKRFCAARGIHFNTEHSEPEDHIGLVLGALSRIFDKASETGELNDVAELLRDHLLPWSDRVVSKILDNTSTGYYRGFTLLMQDLLAHWREVLGVTPRKLELFA